MVGGRILSGGSVRHTPVEHTMRNLVITVGSNNIMQTCFPQQSHWLYGIILLATELINKGREINKINNMGFKKETMSP